MNYMDYVDDDTMVMFTDVQVARMQAALEFSRPELGLPDPSRDGDAPPASPAPPRKRATPRQR